MTAKRPAAPVTGFIDKVMTVDGQERAYVVFVPRGYDGRKSWPLIVFLHGAGERGSDGYKQSEVGLGRAVRMAPDRFPCLVLMPQCPEEGWWCKDGSGWADEFQPGTAHIDRALADTLAEYNVDPARVYLTGLSMGGFGTWIYGAQHADTFAALMPICGGGNTADGATLAKLPIWVFHGANDSVVPVERSREMVEAVKAAGGDVQYSELPNTDHNSWDQAYGNGDAIAWLLSQHR
ncbi:MAG: dienelactone hydrolase family protein [Candidatus Hydrogenedentes bacterium]|nr:dienelactone hydrolase family protein [Candidatus Hydrogenedentota bacterium]